MFRKKEVPSIKLYKQVFSTFEDLRKVENSKELCRYYTYTYELDDVQKAFVAAGFPFIRNHGYGCVEFADQEPFETSARVVCFYHKDKSINCTCIIDNCKIPNFPFTPDSALMVAIKAQLKELGWDENTKINSKEN